MRKKSYAYVHSVEELHFIPRHALRTRKRELKLKGRRVLGVCHNKFNKNTSEIFGPQKRKTKKNVFSANFTNNCRLLLWANII